MDNHHLRYLTKLKYTSTVEDYIDSSKKFYFHTKGMFDTFFWEWFISDLKDDIHAQVLMARPTTWLEATLWA